MVIVCGSGFIDQHSPYSYILFQWNPNSKAGVSPSPGLAVHSGTKHMVEAVADAVRQEVPRQPKAHKLQDLFCTGEGVWGEGGCCATRRDSNPRLRSCSRKQSEQVALVGEWLQWLHREVAASLGCWVPADTSGCLKPDVVAAQVCLHKALLSAGIQIEICKDSPLPYPDF